MFRASLRPALVLLALSSALLGVVYPVVITGVAQMAFPWEANGSLLVSDSGRRLGSALIGQPFTGAAYLHSRPSATGAGPYDGASSSGSNFGPLHPALDSAVRARAAAARTPPALAEARLPSDLVTASGSGLDPHLSPASARLQVARIAAARGLTVAQVQAVIDRYTTGRTAGVLGEPRVNVLLANLALDTQRVRPLR
jgi:K+-transporting ATPase ATPase C chain